MATARQRSTISMKTCPSAPPLEAREVSSLDNVCESGLALCPAAVEADLALTKQSRGTRGVSRASRAGLPHWTALRGWGAWPAKMPIAGAAHLKYCHQQREQKRLSPDEINDRALKIRTELDKAFNVLLYGGKADHADKVTAIFAPYISAGMAFEDAEKILRAVGFTEPTMPGAGEEDRSGEKDRYAVVAEIPRFSQRVFGSVEAYVTPLPLAQGLGGVHWSPASDNILSASVIPVEPTSGLTRRQRRCHHRRNVAGCTRPQARRPTRSSIPPICGSNANRTSRSMTKSSGAGRTRPWEIQLTTLMAASV